MSPVFIDLETRSACDLRVAGGWNYAADPSTSLLTVSWSEEKDVYNVWLPMVDEFDPELLRPPSEQLLQVHLPGTRVFYGADVPPELAALSSRPWCAHNAWTFDTLVWERLGQGVKPAEWLDTYPLALAAGLPGGLNQIGKRLWGEGKYEEGNTLAKQASRVAAGEDPDPRNIPVAQLIQVARYNVQDVRLLYWLWEELQRSLFLPEGETKVLQAHRIINERGALVDTGFLTSLISLSREVQVHALEDIKELTGGFLETKKHLNSRARVFEWLDLIGVDVGPSLRREIVQKWIEKAEKVKDEEGEDEERPEGEDQGEEAGVSTHGLLLASKVLELRMHALRITDAKLAAAMQSINQDRRVRGLFAYWAAHTGRWAGRRIQVHNLPRPKEGVKVWKYISLYEETGALSYTKIKELLPTADPRYKYLSPDDVASALIRSIFWGKSLAAADLANIEARVLAWLAGEEWLLQSFYADADPYMTMAERVFGLRDGWPKYPDPDKSGEFLQLKKHPYRQAGKILELGSGYQLGEARLAMYFTQNGVDVSELGTSPRVCTHAYRDTHPKIAGLEAGVWRGRKYYRGGYWDQLNDAAIAATLGLGPQVVGRITFEKRGGHLCCILPSQRVLVYRAARVSDVVPSYAKGTGKTKPTVTYASPRYGVNSLYGGKLAENIVQAVSRDILAYSMVELEARGFPVVLHVHDEVVAETEDLEGFMSIMTTPPPWAHGFPLDAEGSLAPRYAKSPPPGVNEVVYRDGKYHKGG